MAVDNPSNATYTLIPGAAVATKTPTPMPSDAPRFYLITSAKQVTIGEGSGTAAPTANPVDLVPGATGSNNAIVNGPLPTGTLGTNEFDFDPVGQQWQSQAASGPQATGTVGWILHGLTRGHIQRTS
jgi:hypothetical protein